MWWRYISYEIMFGLWSPPRCFWKPSYTKCLLPFSALSCGYAVGELKALTQWTPAHNSNILLILGVQYLDFNLLGRGSAVHQCESHCCKHWAYFRCWRWLWTKTPRPCTVTDKLKIDVCTYEQYKTKEKHVSLQFDLTWIAFRMHYD